MEGHQQTRLREDFNALQVVRVVYKGGLRHAKTKPTNSSLVDEGFEQHRFAVLSTLKRPMSTDIQRRKASQTPTESYTSSRENKTCCEDGWGRVVQLTSLTGHPISSYGPKI